MWVEMLVLNPFMLVQRWQIGFEMAKKVDPLIKFWQGQWLITASLRMQQMTHPLHIFHLQYNYTGAMASRHYTYGLEFQGRWAAARNRRLHSFISGFLNT